MLVDQWIGARLPYSNARLVPIIRMSPRRGTTSPFCFTRGVGKPMLKRALVVHKSALGPDHSDVGTTLNNVGEVYQAQGRYADARAFSERALSDCVGPTPRHLSALRRYIAVGFQTI